MKLVDLHHDSGVCTITLNRPEKRNALSPELITELEQCVREIQADGEVRVVILSGAGKCFCAGMDLRGVLDDAERMAGMLHGLSRVMRMIRRLSVPTIAAVQGAAVGGGCGLAVVCDYVISHPEAKLGYPEVELGVCPAVVAPWLIRRIGAGPARGLLLAGGTMSAERARAIRMIDQVVDVTELEEECEQLARRLCKGGRQAIAVTKSWLNELEDAGDDAILDQAAAISAEVIAGKEAQARLGRLFGTS